MMDPLMVLPAEIWEHTLQYLDAKSLCTASRVSCSWYHAISSCDKLYKNLCMSNCLHSHITTDRMLGYSWKKILARNYGQQGIKRMWIAGSFSKPVSWTDLPAKHMCTMDADTWGELFQLELDRS